jgi:hypothetical protein
MNQSRPFPLPSDLGLKPASKPSPIVRAAIATARAAFKPRSDTPERVARALYGNDHDVELVLRAVTSPATLTNTPALAQLTKTFLTALKPMSAGIDLLDRGIGLTFDGAAQIQLPALTLPAIDFVGEGAPIPVVQGTSTGGPVLTPHKIAVITTLTSEMLNSSQAEQLVRMVLLNACGPALDTVLLSANAAATDRPAGLRNGIAALTASTSTGEQAMIEDLKALANAVAPVAGNGNLVLVGSPDVTTALQLWPRRPLDWPVLTSSSLAPKTLIMVAAAAVVSAVEGAPLIDAARDAVLHHDTVPSGDLSSAVPVISSFQTDSVALRLRWPITWCLRTPSALAWTSGVAW